MSFAAVAGFAGAGIAAAGATGIATFLSRYPRHAIVTDSHYPVGSCFVRWDGCPACQIFYPAEASACNGKTSSAFFRRELVQNIAKDYLKGWIPACMLNFLSSRGPYHQDAPLDASHGNFPVIIFSHGIWGTLDMYKTVCGGLAASGFIVVALEHEDASALFAVTASGKAIRYSGAPKDFQYGRDNVIEFRKPYLAKRVDEIKNVMRAMSNKAAPCDSVSLVESILRHTSMQDLFLAGHSFGSTTCVMALQDLPGIKGCLLLDLWPAPLPRAIEEKGLHHCPTLLINSQSFAEGKEIAISRKMAANSSSAMGPVWIAGSAHQSFSDTPCILPQALGSKLGFAGKGNPDEVHQAILTASRALFRHCCESSSVLDRTKLELLEEEIVLDRMVSKHFDDPLSKL
jgi:platelet-activating factor acetylhydrolase